MTWHRSETTRDELDALISDIRRRGGTIAGCQRCASGVLITWYTR